MVTIVDQFPRRPAPDLQFSQGGLPPLDIQNARPFKRYVATRRGRHDSGSSMEFHTPADWDELLGKNPHLRASLKSQFGPEDGLWRILNRHKRQEAA